MRDEVVVGLSLPLPQAGQALLMELMGSTPGSQHEKVWIYPRSKGHPSFPQKSHASRCNPASLGDFPAVCIGLRLFPE